MNNWKPVLPPQRKFKKKIFGEAAATGQFIFQIGEYPALRKSSNFIPVEKITSAQMQAKFKYIKKCLLKYRKLTGVGRGITAIQIGIPERFSVIYTPEKLLIIVNPKITKKSEKLYEYPEMCMTANPIIAPTIRSAWIEFEYYDEKGEKQFWKTKDDTDTGRIMNRVFQHEFDHMDGVINLDRIKDPKNLILESDPTYYNKAKFKEV